MSDSHNSSPDLSRRALIAAALGAGAFHLLPEAARAQGATATTELGPPENFSFEGLKSVAQSLARETFNRMHIADPQVLEELDYDNHNAIRFRKEHKLWGNRAGTSPVQFFFPGRYFKEPVHIYALENGVAREVPFSKALFDIPAGNPARTLEGTEGFAGFSVQDEKTGLDWMAFLGAAYWRTSGYSGQFGLSVRALALDTAIPDGPEEFPRFTRFWLEPGANGALTAYALMESPRATGAYKITSRRDNGVLQTVEASVFLRGDVERLGIAPLTSMFWYAKHDRFLGTDWRPEVHDSDGLQVIGANGERIWRPINNPPRVMANSFFSPSVKGFGLMQRERDFQQYQDDGVFYEKRASAWIEPVGDWGEGAVTLIELPTDDEIHDNIVAFWVPQGPAQAGARYDIAYKLSWVKDCPVPPIAASFIATRIGAGGIPGQPRPKDVVKIVCDFDGLGMEGLARGPEVSVTASTSRGTVSNSSVYPVVGTDYWRAMFDLDFSMLAETDDEAIDLRMFVEAKGEAKTETWLGQLFPSQLRRLLAQHG